MKMKLLLSFAVTLTVAVGLSSAVCNSQTLSFSKKPKKCVVSKWMTALRGVTKEQPCYRDEEDGELVP